MTASHIRTEAKLMDSLWHNSRIYDDVPARPMTKVVAAYSGD